MQKLKTLIRFLILLSGHFFVNYFMANMKIVFTVLLLFFHLYAQNSHFSLERINKSDHVYRLIEDLFIISGEVNPPDDMLLTYGTARELLERWRRRHPRPPVEQQNYLQELENYLDIDQAKAGIELRLGVDMLYHNLPDCTQAGEFSNTFRDYDFDVKYQQRGRFFDARLKLPVNEYLFISTVTSLRNDWMHFNERAFDFPRNLKELNVNVNEKATLLFHFKPLTIIAGRDRLRLGVGETGTLLYSYSLPPVDHLRIQLRYKDIISFNHFIASIKPNTLEGEYPKLLYTHRLSVRLFEKLTMTLTEMIISNQTLRAAYMNPFFIFHNMYDYPENRNVSAALDVEFVPRKQMKVYFSWLVDEMDAKALEEHGDRGRSSWGLMIGTKWVNPFRVMHSHFTVEWVNLTTWLYNHGYPWFDFYSLNAVYEENRDKMNPVYFHRFLGHQLGPNSNALNFVYHLLGAEIGYQYSERGTIPIFTRAFSKPVPSLKEYRHVFTLKYQNDFWDDRIRLSAVYSYGIANNFHQTPGLHKTLHQFWLTANFRVFSYQW